jgi:hypothetical protein
MSRRFQASTGGLGVDGYMVEDLWQGVEFHKLAVSVWLGLMGRVQEEVPFYPPRDAIVNEVNADLDL